jgi:hypothetical protein
LIRIEEERGIVKGRAIGRNEARDEGWSESVLDLLSLKFPEAPQTIKKRNPKLSTLQKQQLFKLLVTTESLSEIRQWFSRETK